MPLEKCHHCTYGEAEHAELVVQRCSHHTDAWDATIENVELRATVDRERLPYEAPSVTDSDNPELAASVIEGEEEAPKTPRDRGSNVRIFEWEKTPERGVEEPDER